MNLDDGTDPNAQPIPIQKGRVFSTGYSPQVAGDSTEGDYKSSIAGPDGSAVVRTLEDVRTGASPYVTLAGDPSLYGASYTIPQVTYQANGKSYTLKNVPAVVHDSGPAFKGQPAGRFDIAVGRDLNMRERNQDMSATQFVPSSSALAYSGETPQFQKDFPGAVASVKADIMPTASATPQFLKDFPAAASTPATSTAPATPASPSAPQFLQDFPAAAAPLAKANSETPHVPSPIGVNDSVRAVGTGFPIIGGLLNSADAATNATIAPVFNRFFDPKNQLQGENWSDRYNNALKIQNGMDQQFASDHPVANTALNVAGGIAGTAPAMMAAPAAFGISEAPLVVNALTGAATGATIGAADNVARNGLSTANIESGALMGGLSGAAGPIIGAGIGKAIGAGSNLLNRTTPAAANAANMLRSAEMTPAEAQSSIARMGNDATFADVHPLMNQEAQGIASMGGTPTAILKSAMAARAAGTDGRVEQSIVSNLGERPDITVARDAIAQDASSAASPYYNAARANPQPMDVVPVLSDIDAQMKIAPPGSAEAAVLAKAKGYLIDQRLTIPGPNGNPISMAVPRSDPSSLLKARQALDGDIKSMIERGMLDNTSASKSAVQTAQDIRGQLDGVLKSDPNIAAGDKAFAGKIVAKNDLDTGTEIFKPSTNLEDFQRSVQNASADPYRLQAMQKGALSSLHDRIGGSQGDYAAARNLFAKGSLNRAKLDALFPNSGAFLDNLEGEITKRSTENAIRSGSQTADKLAIQQKYNPSASSSFDPSAAVIGNALDGGIGAAALTAGKAVYGGLSNAFAGAARNRLIEGTARGLVATGPEQNAFMSQVGRAYRAQPVTKALSVLGSGVSNLLSRPLLQAGEQEVLNRLQGSRQ
jgi:hypothetical protein